MLYKYGNSGIEIKDLRKRLNIHGDTCQGSLFEFVSFFNSHMMARVMEFQYYKGTTPDGIVGPKTIKKLNAPPKPTSKKFFNRCVIIDLMNNYLWAYDSGKPVKFSTLEFLPIKGGTKGHPTKRGAFRMKKRRLRKHTSSLYPYPPGNMDFSLFFDGARAIHKGPTTDYDPKTPEDDSLSHGCIHVEPHYAEKLFDWAGNKEILVLVLKPTR